MSTPEEWSRAFAVQAASDLKAREILMDAELPECHQLHFLQMACEKLCKSHLYGSGQDADVFQKSHAYVAKVLPILVRQYLRSDRSQGWTLNHIRHLAREIELLAPAVDDGGRRPENCEYPWEDASDSIQTPAESNFPGLSLLTNPAGRLLLKVIQFAAVQLARPTT